MSYLKAPETDQLTLPSDPAFWVKLKRQATYGDSSAAQSAMLHVSQGGNGSAGQLVSEMEIGAYLRALILHMVVEWNLTDVNEQLLPINETAIEQLRSEDGEFLAAEAQKRLGRRPESEQVPFGKLSSPVSTATRSSTPKQSG